VRAARVMGSGDDTEVPEPLMPASLGVVVLALFASVGWGASDFGGGLASRHAPVAAVLFASQLGSLVIASPTLLVVAEPAMRLEDVALSAACGICGATGLGFLYRGLSVGRMGVVAPVAAVLTATIPVVFGFVTQGLPSTLGLAGIVVAGGSVVLVSRPAESVDAGPSGLVYALVAGTFFGLFTILASQLEDALIVTPIFLIRLASVVTVGTWIVIRRPALRMPRRLWPWLVGIGLLDMAATGLYLAAIAVGPLAIAAILASLYPVVTTILAVAVLRERVTPAHAAGILAAVVAVALIAGATA
jgi:drug/metabolite transporter (DMT)-like permease